MAHLETTDNSDKDSDVAAIDPNRELPIVIVPIARRSRLAIASNALLGFFILLVCLYFGEGLQRWLHAPLPRPVIGLALLALLLIMLVRFKAERHADCVESVARVLISHMGLLFVPAGAGIMMEGALLWTQWLPIVAALVVSTWIGLAATGWVMQHD